MTFVSKLSKVAEIFNANTGLGRDALVELFVEKLGINKGTATTYYYKLIKGDAVEAKKPVAPAPVVATETVAPAPKKRGRPAKDRSADPILAAVKGGIAVNKPAVIAAPATPKAPVVVETALAKAKLSRTAQPTGSQLQADFNKLSAKEKETWATDIARYAEEYKNTQLFGK